MLCDDVVVAFAWNCKDKRSTRHRETEKPVKQVSDENTYQSGRVPLDLEFCFVVAVFLITVLRNICDLGWCAFLFVVLRFVRLGSFCH